MKHFARHAVCITTVAAALALCGACGSDSDLGGEGQPCFGDNTCRAGLSCDWRKGVCLPESAFECRYGVKEGDHCMYGFCVEVEGGGFTCASGCATMGDACENGQFCYGVKYGNVCRAQGTAKMGEACNSTIECVMGYPCIFSFCRQVCKKDSDCPVEGDTCQKLEGTSFVVCWPKT